MRRWPTDRVSAVRAARRLADSPARCSSGLVRAAHFSRGETIRHSRVRWSREAQAGSLYRLRRRRPGGDGHRHPSERAGRRAADRCLGGRGDAARISSRLRRRCGSQRRIIWRFRDSIGRIALAVRRLDEQAAMARACAFGALFAGRLRRGRGGSGHGRRPRRDAGERLRRARAGPSLSVADVAPDHLPVGRRGQKRGTPASIAVTDRVGNVLAVFQDGWRAPPPW